MTIEKAIEIAGNNGFKFNHGYYDAVVAKGKGHRYAVHASMLLDRAFWESLAAGMGVRTITISHPAREITRVSKRGIIRYRRPAGTVKRTIRRQWKPMWHRFIDGMADGGTPEQFFETLR